MIEYKTRKGGDSVRQRPNRHIGTVTLLHKKDDNGMVEYFCTSSKCTFKSHSRKEARDHYKNHV